MVVVGPVTRDVTVWVSELPLAGGSAVAERLIVAAGGKGANPAVCAARLGAHVRIVGAVGADLASAEALTQLESDAIDVGHVQCHPGDETGQIVHIVEPGGRRRYLELRGANEHLTLQPGIISQLCAPDTVVLISTALPRAAVEAAAAGARRAAKLVCADLAGDPAVSRGILSHLDLARSDASEASALTGCDVHDFSSAAVAAARLRQHGPRVAAIQAGADGDLVQSDDAEIRVPRHRVSVIDPTGGGDAFIATLIVLLARGQPLKDAAELASAAAAHTVAHLGGRPTFNSEEEVRSLLG